MFVFITIGIYIQFSVIPTDPMSQGLQYISFIRREWVCCHLWRCAVVSSIQGYLTIWMTLWNLVRCRLTVLRTHGWGLWFWLIHFCSDVWGWTELMEGVGLKIVKNGWHSFIGGFGDCYPFGFYLLFRCSCWVWASAFWMLLWILVWARKLQLVDKLWINVVIILNTWQIARLYFISLERHRM